MEQKIIVFDMDDVLWDLNGRASKLTGVDIEKLDTFLIYENKNLTDKERNSILELYGGTRLYENIMFDPVIVEFANMLHQDYPEYRVEIRSNCASTAIRDLKYPQLRNVLKLPDNQIHLHVIDIATESGKKKLPENMFLIVDDSPFNIRQANAEHKIMPAKPWNNVLKDGCLDLCRVHRPVGSLELIAAVMQCINESRT